MKDRSTNVFAWFTDADPMDFVELGAMWWSLSIGEEWAAWPASSILFADGVGEGDVDRVDSFATSFGVDVERPLVCSCGRICWPVGELIGWWCFSCLGSGIPCGWSRWLWSCDLTWVIFCWSLRLLVNFSMMWTTGVLVGALRCFWFVNYGTIAAIVRNSNKKIKNMFLFKRDFFGLALQSRITNLLERKQILELFLFKRDFFGLA